MVDVFCSVDVEGLPPVIVQLQAVTVPVLRSFKGTLCPTQTGLVTSNEAVGAVRPHTLALKATIAFFPQIPVETFRDITSFPAFKFWVISVLLFCAFARA